MNIDKCINDVVKEALKDNNKHDDIKNMSLDDLVRSEILSDDIKNEIYIRFKNDIDNLINDFLIDSDDPAAANGMYKCSLETWQACADLIGMTYFRKYKYMHDIKREAWEGGSRLRDDLLCVGLELYEYYCKFYRKQFFIYDCCRFLGIDKVYLYKLNTLHSTVLKNAHTVQEASMRAALASGRSNVTAMAILLNHDYDYTRTTQVIHTSSNENKTAAALPVLDNTQDIARPDLIENKNILCDGL